MAQLPSPPGRQEAAAAAAAALRDPGRGEARRPEESEGEEEGREKAAAPPRSARPSAPLGGKGRALAGSEERRAAGGGSRSAGTGPGRLSPSMPAEGELRRPAAAGPENDEPQYLRQVQHILQHGHRKQDRTGTGTISVFGMQARYSLRGWHRRDPRPSPRPPTLPAAAPAVAALRRGGGGGTPSFPPALSRSGALRARPPPIRGRGLDPLQGPVEAFRCVPSAPSPSPCPPAGLRQLGPLLSLGPTARPGRAP